MTSEAYIHQLFGMAGRTAVVTGGSSGLGAEMARVLARSGARVLAVARRQELLESLASSAPDAEGSIHPCVADLTTETGIQAVTHAVERLGGCDVLVANAGVLEGGALAEVSAATFSRVLDVNLLSQWALAKCLLTFLKGSRAGRVINIASIVGVGGPVRIGVGPYVVSKHALIGLTRTQAVEWAPFGITANAIAPGYHYTELTAKALDDPELSERLKRFIPLGRFGSPHELATALLFLASPSSSYVTGIVLPVDGGWTSW
jgi:NAD(P)-dependent dehydrogenase (short-subunit alcohol dehydrogenase family)